MLPDNFVWDVPITVRSGLLLRLPINDTLDLSTGTPVVLVVSIYPCAHKSRYALNDEDLSGPVASYLLQRSALMLELLRGPPSEQCLTVQMQSNWGDGAMVQ